MQFISKWLMGQDDLDIQVKFTVQCANPYCDKRETVVMDSVPLNLTQVYLKLNGWLMFTDEDLVCGPDCLHKMHDYYG